MTVTEAQLFATGEDDIELRFLQFDRAHPAVFEQIARIAHRRLDAGARRISMKWCFEVVREGDWTGDSHSPVKLNNDFSALYTRKLIARYPELAPLFKTRKRKP